MRMSSLSTLSLKRVVHLFRMDLRRLLRGKAFYAMVAVSVFIPVMMLTQMSEIRDIATFIGSDGASGGGFGAGMNLSILVVLTGMLLCIYIGGEYSTGFIKNIITAHANKLDYILVKLMVASICTATFFLAYLITLFAVGGAMGVPAGAFGVGGLVLYVIEKLLLSVPMTALMIAVALVFRSGYGWSIMFICIAATGIVTLSAQAGLRMLGLGPIADILSFTVTGASSFATLAPSATSLVVIMLVSAAWTLVWLLVADRLMSKRDVL